LVITLVVDRAFKQCYNTLTQKEKCMRVEPGTLYKVTVTEYDSGVQRVDPDDTRFYTTLEEARAYKAHWETGGSRECYWRAEIHQIG
jgi:hypothetical protein